MNRVYPAEPHLIGDKYIFLNTERDVESARDFFKTSEQTYSSLDPRLYDPVRNIRMDLDRPPYQPKNVQPLQNIYSDCNSERVSPIPYTEGYSSIYGGDITYYIDPKQCLVYDSPNYVLRSAVVPYILQTPMGSNKPHYERIPLFQQNNNVAPYTFDADQMSFREDIMSRQSAQFNQRDYSYYVGHFLPKNESLVEKK